MMKKSRQAQRIAIALILGFASSGAVSAGSSASVTTSPSVKYKVFPVKHLNGRKISKDILIQKVQLEAAAGLSAASIRAINQELAQAVNEFKSDADECHSSANPRHPWGYESKIEKIVLTKKYISFVFARFTVCAGSPDFEKDPLVFSTKDGRVVSVTDLFESTFPGRTMPEISEYNKRRVMLTAEMVAALLHDSRIALKDFDKECEFYLKRSPYMAWIEDKRMILVPEFLQAESSCQKEYVIDLALAATPGLKYDKKKQTVSLTANGGTLVLERFPEDEAPELAGMDEYIRILPKELQPYSDRGILLLNTAVHRPCGEGPGKCDSEHEMYLHAVDVNHSPPRQVSKVPLWSCSKYRYPDKLKGGAGDFSAYDVDEDGRLNIASCGRSATLSQDMKTLEFYE